MDANDALLLQTLDLFADMTIFVAKIARRESWDHSEPVTLIARYNELVKLREVMAS